MSKANFEQKVQDKTREELVEVCFQSLLEVKVARGELIGPTAASATESFKKKLENKPREELVTMCVDALKERQASQQQNKRKVPEAELTDEGEHKKQRQAPHATTYDWNPGDPPLMFIHHFSKIAQSCELSALRLCRHPRCSDCYEKLIGKFEVAVQAMCTDLPAAKPQSTEKATEWDKAYGDAYTTQQMCLDSFSIDQPTAAQNLREWFVPGVLNPFLTRTDYSRQSIAAWMIGYYSKLLRQRREDGASEQMRADLTMKGTIAIDM